MSGDLWICRACDLASLAIELRPQRILSIAEPGFRNPTPDGIAPDDHHHLNFDDITEAMADYVEPSEQHVGSIIELAGALSERDRILVHCQAGISRSSAAALIILALTAVLVKGIKESARANTVLVLIKITVLIVFVAAGAAYVQRDHLVPFIPANTGDFGAFGWSGVMRATGIMFFAYIGFDAVSTAAQESANPKRDLPFAILSSLTLCTILYIAVADLIPGLHRRVDPGSGVKQFIFILLGVGVIFVSHSLAH